MSSPQLVRGARWIIGAVMLLVVVALMSSLARYVLPQWLHLRIAAVLFSDLAGHLPVMATYPITEALHRLGGALYLLLGMVQFIPRVRMQHPAWHRRSGLVFLVLTLIVGVSGMWMGVAIPYRPGESVPSLMFGAIMLVCAGRAYLHARRREFRAHREWMIRSFAVGLGVGTMRVVGIPILTSRVCTAAELITPLFWFGWGSTLLVAELWIRATRAAPRR